MGLLTQAMAGMVSGAADAGYKMLDDQNKAAIQTERDKALALKEQNLARFKHGLDEESKIAQEKRTISAEERKAGGTLTDYEDENGMPMTKDQVIKASKIKQEAAEAKRSGLLASASEETARIAAPSGREQVTSAMGLDIDLGFGSNKEMSPLADPEAKYTPEQQAIIDKADAIKLENAKTREKRLELQGKREDAAAAREERGYEKQKDRELRKEIADDNNATRREGQEARKADKSEKLSPDEKRLQELYDREGTQRDGLTPRQKEERDNLEAKLHPGRGPEPPSEDKVSAARSQAKKEANEKAGYLSRDKTDFADDGGDKDAFIERRTQEILAGKTGPTTTKGKGVTSTAKPAAPAGLPSGAIAVPGKRTKDGRQVYKTSDGQLIAPK